MANETKSKTIKIVAWVAGVIIFICMVLAIGWHLFKKDLANPKSKIVKPLLTNELKKMLAEASDSLYHLSYSTFNLNIDSGKGFMAHIRLVPDTGVLKRLITQHKAPNNIFTVNIDSIKINHFGFVKGKNGKSFSIESVSVFHPVITLANKRRGDNDSTNKTPILLKLVKDMFKSINVKKLVMTNLTFTLLNQNDKVEKHTALKNLTVSISGFTTDTPGGKNASAQINRLRFKTPDSLYFIDFDRLQFFSQQKDLLIGKFSILPRLGINAFYKTVRYNKDRFHMVFNNMSLNHIDMERIIKKQQIHIGNVNVGSYWTEVFNSYRWPKRLPPVRLHGYSHEQLQRMAYDVTIDTMTMHKGYTSYKIAAVKSDEVANFFFTNTDCRFYNITNNTAAKRKDHIATAFMQTRLMNAGLLNASFRFNLYSKNGDFSYIFDMGKMNGKALNPLSRPLALVNVDSADVDRFYMQVHANEQMATGNVNLYYKNMKISLLKNDKNADTLKKKKLVSFFANIALPNDNPKKDGKFRKGPINVTRDPRTSFLGFIYQCMLDGITSSVSGFNQHKDKPDKNTVISIGSKIAKPQKPKLIPKHK